MHIASTKTNSPVASFGDLNHIIYPSAYVLKARPAMPYISHALRIKAIALQINFGMQLPLNQFKGFSQQLSDGIRRLSLLIEKKTQNQNNKPNPNLLPW